MPAAVTIRKLCGQGAEVDQLIFTKMTTIRSNAMDRTDLANKVGAAMLEEIGVTDDPFGDYPIDISQASTVAVATVLDELDYREGSRVLGPEQCCERGCNGGACESCTCCAAGWCVTGRDGLPADAEDLAIWLKYASEHNPLAKALAVALDRVTDLEVTAHAAGEYVMAGLCGNDAADQREKLGALIEVARTDR